MPVDISKHLDKAKKYLERNKLADAAEAYQSALNEAPNNPEALQGLGDIHTRMGQPDRAATYYGPLFDRLFDLRDENKALVLYTRALRGTQQPPERMARYALLLQRQGRTTDAIENYVAASELLLARGKQEPALDCLDRAAQLDPENVGRQFAAGCLAEQLGRSAIAVRAFLRAAQLSEAAGDPNASLALLERAYKLAPADRGPALLYAQALLRRGQAGDAVGLLNPHANTESDAVFLNTLSQALTANGELDRARGVLERLLRQDAATLPRLFDLARLYMEGGQEDKAVALLRSLQDWAISARRENDFANGMDALAASYGDSAQLAEFCAAVYAALNRESAYFHAMERLFDIYLKAGDSARAGDALDRLAEIDPYDSGNQKRLQQLESSGNPVLIERIRARLAQVATNTPRQGADPEPADEEGSSDSPGDLPALEDLVVQAEIFLQYSLQSKAIETLQRIAKSFPGEEDRNKRLRSLYKMSGWWPEGKGEPAPAKSQAAARADSNATDNADTLRDLAKLSEISQSLHRQPSAKAIVATAIQEVGQHMRATRCFAVLGAAGRPPQMASEYCAPGLEPSPGALLVRLLAQFEQATPDGLGGLLLQQQSAPLLAELGLDSMQGVFVIDPETKTQAGVMLAGYAGAHAWRPHEKYFLQTVGDQMLLGVSHTRLRTMTRTLGAADEKTGLLTRSSYLDCLLQETQRTQAQGGAFTVALVQMDRGVELLRQYGEAAVERYLEQLAQAFRPVARQSDLAIKYTSWAIAFILPDTPQAAGESQAERIRQAGAAVRPPWEGPVALSASVAEAAVRAGYDNEDIVTELVNRAEAGLDEALRRGGSALVSLSVQALRA